MEAAGKRNKRRGIATGTAERTSARGTSGAADLSASMETASGAVTNTAGTVGTTAKSIGNWAAAGHRARASSAVAAKKTSATTVAISRAVPTSMRENAVTATAAVTADTVASRVKRGAASAAGNLTPRSRDGVPDTAEKDAVA
jgi:hypothetical protein